MTGTVAGVIKEIIFAHVELGLELRLGFRCYFYLVQVYGKLLRLWLICDRLAVLFAPILLASPYLFFFSFLFDFNFRFFYDWLCDRLCDRLRD